jgi:DUF971 family protein|tara:strand:+ start:227 stop:532 length:306 start_codon:yes stop_codon:yes gene_type:complete
MIPKSVTLNRNKKSIQLEYPNNKFLLLTSSYLRACSPSAENKDKLRKSDVREREKAFHFVMINKVEAVGNYAIRIIFDDGHSTGIFSWEYIYNIGSRLQDS